MSGIKGKVTEKKMKKTLTIGELSALFQMNVQTLHYYDSIRLLVPAVRDPITGHRKYHFEQVYKLASIRYMRKLGYSLKQIDAYMESRDIGFTLDHLKEQSQVLRKKWQDLINIDTAIQRKIGFIEQEMKQMDIDKVTVKEFPERWYIPIGKEEVLYGNDSFYFYPTIAFYEHDLKYFGAYLFCEEESQSICDNVECPETAVIPAGKFLCGYHLGPYERILESAERIRQSAGDLVLADNLINFNIIDQFVERDSEKYITEMQILIID